MNLRGLFDAKLIFVKEQQWYYLINSWEDKGTSTIPLGISPKVNMKEWLEFEITDQDGLLKMKVFHLHSVVCPLKIDAGNTGWFEVWECINEEHPVPIEKDRSHRWC